jgi:hypothetical protein
MDYEYGLRPATNRMAMARGAKYMKVHNLPGWYNTGGNLFGETRVRPVLTQEDKNARRKPKIKSPSPILSPVKIKSPSPEYTKTSNRIYHVGANHTHAGMGSVHTNKAGFGYIQKSNGSYHAIVNKILNGAKTSNKHGGITVRAYSLGNTPSKKWAELRNTSYLGHAAVFPSRPKSPNTVFNFPNVNVNSSGNKWTVPRQSGVKMYNKRSLMSKITGSIGPNSKGMGWAKVRGEFVPLIGTRSKGGGYVVNMKGLNKPAKYDDVVKGIHSFRI